MNILITGGRGYLGRYIVDRLLDDGHTIINYSRDMQLPNEDPKNIFAFGELYDIPRLVLTIDKYKVDRIIHTAAQSHPDVGVDVPFATTEANVMGTMGIFESARLTGIKRIVCFSSECAYGNTTAEVMDESHPLCPTNPYGVTKAVTEMMARAYNNCYETDIVSLRSGQVYGPGQIMQEYIRDAIKAAVKGDEFILEEGSDQKFQLVHITDVVDATIKACFTDIVNELAVYNITSGYQPTFGEVLEILKEIIPDAKFNVGSGNLGYDINGIFKIDAAKKDLGYEPKVSLKDGLREYVEWLTKSDY